jgi:GDP-L-fucose synthase
MKTASVLVAGASKALGRAIVEAIGAHGGFTALDAPQPDWSDQAATDRFFAKHAPSHVIIAAGASGGISFNRQHPATLIRDNLMVAANVIHAAHASGVKRLLFLASSCIYPRLSEQPITEDALLTGPLEPTNQAYALAKIAGVELCRAYRTEYEDDFIPVVPTNYFGPGDDFSPENSHVIGALIRRMHEAKEQDLPFIEIWGTGKARREFMYTRDLGRACVFLLEHYQGGDLVNVGTGFSLSIGELAEIIRDIVGYTGDLRYDVTKPDGMPIKELDGSIMQSLGWQGVTPFRDALADTYQWFLENKVK